jgi:hypothetical protein
MKASMPPRVLHRDTSHQEESSEAQFKTLKYRPGAPFFAWYHRQRQITLQSH